MTVKLGLLVGESGNWTFLREVATDLQRHYDVEIYRPRTYSVPLLQGRLSRWGFRAGLRAMLRRNDVCFFEWASELLMSGSQMPSRSAIVTRLHSFELLEWAPRIEWAAVDRVVLVSHSMQARFAALYPEHASRTVVVHNGCDLARFGTESRQAFAFQIGMLGHIAPIKRVYEVVLMFRALASHEARAHLHLAGASTDGRYAAAVQRLVQRLGLSGRVTLHGHVEDAPAWLRNIDILISNSYWEGQQVALIEGMAAGCFCVSHFWDGAEEVLPAQNLFTSEQELLDRILGYAYLTETDKQRRQREMRDRVEERFDIRRTCAGIRQAIEDARACGRAGQQPVARARCELAT